MLTLSVGIPAYNRARNIEKLIRQILEQDRTDFILDKIIIVSDSTDETNSIVVSMNDPHIETYFQSERKGKAFSLNKLFKVCESDVLVQLDADVRLLSNFDLNNLAAHVGQGVDLVFGCCKPITPKTLHERYSYFGYEWWQEVLSRIEKQAGESYRCEGRCRAFSKKFYKSFILPDEADIAEDVFSYYFAISREYKVKFADDVVIQYRLPSSKDDYIKQSKRYVKSRDVLARYFPNTLLAEREPLKKVKYFSLFKMLFKNSPFIFFGYVFTQYRIHKLISEYEGNPGWEYIGSSKNLD